jgi:hypothetical protein
MGESSASRPGRALSQEKGPGTHWLGGWVGLMDGMDTEPSEKKSFATAEDRALVVQYV